MRLRYTILTVFWLLAASVDTGQLFAADPHILFEERCGRCHDHAGPFVAATIVLRDGQAFTKTDDEPLEPFLRDHRRHLSNADAVALAAHMTRIARRNGLFRSKCGMCHDNARDLARTMLIERDDGIYGRYSGRDMADFLRSHGRATDLEAGILLTMLREQLAALDR